MKHLPFENWILDEPALTKEEAKKLEQHLAVCKHCCQLQSGWEASKLFLIHPKISTPIPGFTDRWQKTFVRKCNIEKVRRYRLSMFGLIMLSVLLSAAYLVASGSFLQILANSLNTLMHTFMSITNGLASLRSWINQLPFEVPLTAGFIFFGLMNAFLMSAAFLLWNLKNRKKLVNETPLD